MRAPATTGNGFIQAPALAKVSSSGKHRRAPYTRAHDDRKRPIRGLWTRNGAFYAQITIEEHDSGRKQVKRLRLKAQSPAAARKEMQELQQAREAGTLPILKLTPSFSEYKERYLDHFRALTGAKKASTLEKEEGILENWAEHLGHLRLNQIKPNHINSFREKRQRDGIASRTVNLDLIVLRNLLKKAKLDGLIRWLPTENIRPLKVATPKRPLYTWGQVEEICQKAFAVSKNGQQLNDYLRLMAFCGSRRDETLRLQWTDLDWERQQLVIGSDAQVKNSEYRIVDFNARLEQHLREMLARRAPDSIYLFPSPQRGERDQPARSFRESLDLARKAAGFPGFGFHDCRHFFISMCVMSGIDFMTIARWVGHKDGGILIGKVYGHLADTHRKAMAEKVRFSHGL